MDLALLVNGVISDQEFLVQKTRLLISNGPLARRHEERPKYPSKMSHVRYCVQSGIVV